MNNSPKFTMNALIIVASVFTALTLIVTVGIVNTKNPFPVNEYYPIEGSEYAVRYSTFDKNGIYKGPKNSCELVLEGSFGANWGNVRSGDHLYTNEYHVTDLGLTLCDLVRIDLDTLEKVTLFRDTLLRGKCASGEMVCIKGYIMPSDFPKTNPLTALYSMTGSGLDSRQRDAEVIYLDPLTGRTLYSVRTPDALAEDFEDIFLSRTLGEVRG